MENKIHQQAVLCKEHADKRIESCHIKNVSTGTERNFVQGDVKGYESLLIGLRETIKDKYPLIEKQLSEVMDKYDSYPYRYQGILESIVETIISLELQAKISDIKVNDTAHKSRKFFISHSSNDKIVVDGFIKEILMLGCGFKYDDIFCTLDTTSIRTGDDFREEIVKNMRECDYVLLFISENYNQSDVCKNEMGAAWALGKRVLPFVLPGISFSQMGFLNVVKQGALVTDKSKLDEFYNEVCSFYEIKQDWINFNKSKDSFIDFINERNKSIGKIVIG